MGYPHRFRCCVCGKRGSARDPITDGHIIPRSRGGPDEPWNIRPEHASCNTARGSSYNRDLAALAAERRQQWLARRRP